ncbi:MAG: hypothetical protein ACYC9Y_16355 [Candidatus Methylomirabilia bacterium]
MEYPGGRRGPQSGAGYRYAGLTFRVSSANPADVRWLDEFLQPHYRRAPPAPDAIEVALVIDSERYERLVAAFLPEQTMPSFVFDNEVKELPCRSGDDGALLLFEASFPAFYEVSADRRRVRIVGARVSPRLRLALVRVMREYAMNESQRCGEFFLHASCFLAGGRPVIVTGPKLAGKTTLLTFACLRGGGRFLANDRVRVCAGEDGFTVKSVPVIVKVREGTLGFFPGLRERILSEGMHYTLAGGESLEHLDPRPVLGNDGSFALSPAQACALFGADQAAEARRPVVVLPAFTGEAGGFSITRLSPAQAAGPLQESLFGARHWAPATPAFNLEPESGSGASARQAACERFRSEVPILRCAVGRDLYDEPGGARRWIDALLAAAGTPA